MTDNFSIIYNEFEEPKFGDFYMVSIISRRKDGHPIDHTVTTYTVNSFERLKILEDEIKKICNVLNARAYISIVPKNYNRMYKKVAVKLVDMLINMPTYTFVNTNVMRSSMSEDKNEKRFLIDADDNCEAIYEAVKDHVICSLPTKHGYHYICEPFNREEINIDCDVHINGLTLLYENLKG